MKKMVLIALLVLAGCEDRAVQKERIEKELPPDCSMTDLGEYGYISNLVVIQCDGRPTTTTAGAYRAGKAMSTYTTVEIGGGA